MSIRNLGFGKEIVLNLKGSEILWNGHEWRNAEDSIMVGIEDPPTYLQIQLKKTNVAPKILGGINKPPQIRLKDYDQVSWDILKNHWYLNDGNIKRRLPTYMLDRPGKEILDLLATARAEYKGRR